MKGQIAYFRHLGYSEDQGTLKKTIVKFEFSERFLHHMQVQDYGLYLPTSFTFFFPSSLSLFLFLVFASSLHITSQNVFFCSKWASTFSKGIFFALWLRPFVWSEIALWTFGACTICRPDVHVGLWRLLQNFPAFDLPMTIKFTSLEVFRQCTAWAIINVNRKRLA